MAGIILLAVLIEGLITYLFGKKEGDTRRWIQYVSLALGVVLAVAYRIDIPSMVGLMSPVPYVSFIVSGIVIGRGANYTNDLIGSIRG